MAVSQYRPNVPPSYWEAVAPFVVPTAREAAPHVAYSLNRLLSNLAQFSIWAWQSAGLPLEREILLQRDVIEAYAVHCTAHLSPTSAGNVRSLLLRVAEVLLPPTHRVTRLTPLCNPNPSEPYTASEVRELRSWATGQITAARRTDCQTLLCLGLGAGLSAREIKMLRTDDVLVDDEGVLIKVRGDRPRVVPVLAAWEGHLAALAASNAPGRLMFAPGRKKPDTRNAVSGFVAHTSGPLKPTSHRLRATWIVQHLAAGTPLIPFMEAAGLATLEVLDRYMRYVPGVIDIGQARALLRRQLEISPGLRALS